MRVYPIGQIGRAWKQMQFARSRKEMRLRNENNWQPYRSNGGKREQLNELSSFNVGGLLGTSIVEPVEAVPFLKIESLEI